MEQFDEYCEAHHDHTHENEGNEKEGDHGKNHGHGHGDYAHNHEDDTIKKNLQPVATDDHNCHGDAQDQDLKVKKKKTVKIRSRKD